MADPIIRRAGAATRGADPVVRRAKPVDAPFDARRTLDQVLGGAYQGTMGLADQVIGMTPFAGPGGMLDQAGSAADRIAALMQAATGDRRAPAAIAVAPRPAGPVSGAFNAGARAAQSTIASTGATPGPTPADVAADAPRNRAERYARVAGIMAPNAILPGPGGAGLIPQVLARGANVILPTIGSEGAREAAQAAGGGQTVQTAAAIGGGLLGGLGAGVRPVRGLIPEPSISPAAALKAEGVSLTPGQRFGGVARTAEDIAMNAPILGHAIHGARVRGLGSFNRAVANRALGPIGETLPPNVKPGNDTAAHVATRLGAAYDRASAAITSLTPDEQFAANMAEIRQGLKGQATPVQKDFDRIVSDRITSRLSAGPMDGAALQDMRTQVGQIASDYISAGGPNAQVGRHLQKVDAALDAMASRQNPNYGPAKAAADEGWANYVRLRRASSATGAEGGVFTPSQLKSAVRAEDETVGKGATAKGGSLLYDLADTGTSVMGSGSPSARIADRAALIGGGLTLGQPHIGVPAAVGLAAAATPYLLMGRRIVTALGPAASRSDLATAEARLSELAAKDAAVVPLHQQVLQMIEASAPVAGVAAAASANGY